MKANIAEIVRYSFCPKFYEQEGDIPAPDHESQTDFRALITYVFRKELETACKVGWKDIQNRWSKIFWEHQEKTKENEQKYNRSLIAIKQFFEWYYRFLPSVLAVNFSLNAPIYTHQIQGLIPVIGNNGIDDTVTLVMTESLSHIGEANCSPQIRYLSLALDQTASVSSIVNLSLTNYKSFHAFVVSPDKRFWESSMLDLLGLFQSMQEKVSYPNTMACSFCPIARVCEAMNSK